MIIISEENQAAFLAAGDKYDEPAGKMMQDSLQQTDYSFSAETTHARVRAALVRI